MLQAQQQRNLNNVVSQPSKPGSRRPKKEVFASSDPEVKNSSPTEQDSGILDVEDEEEEEASVCTMALGVAQSTAVDRDKL